jgi:AcrR family transcriptional regulator
MAGSRRWPLARPQRPPLTQERIVAATLRIIDDEGLQAVTMRRLGKELHIDSMALYRHFRHKRAILQEVVHSVMDDIRYPEDGTDWRENLRSLASSVRDRLLAHPNMLPLLLSPAFLPETLLESRALALIDLEAAGMEPLSAASLMHLVTSFVRGHCLTVSGVPAGALVNEGSLDFSDYPEVLRPGHEPALGGWEPISFDTGLDCILRGAEVLSPGLTPEAPSATPQGRAGQ